MCLILERDPDAAPIPDDVLASVIDRNPDGFGVMTLDNAGVLCVDKIPPKEVTPDKVRAVLELHAGRRQILHWRKATSGPVDLAMTHPFVLVDRRIAMMHNGVLAGGCRDESDTAAWARVIAPLFQQVADGRVSEDTIAAVTALSRIVGSSSVVILGAIRDGSSLWIGGQGETIPGLGRVSNRYAWSGTCHPAYVPASMVQRYGPLFDDSEWSYAAWEARRTKRVPDPIDLPLPKGETRAVKASARALYRGPNMARTAQEVADDERLYQIATRTGRLTESDRAVLDEIRKRRAAKAEVAQAAQQTASRVLANVPIPPARVPLKRPDSSCDLADSLSDEDRALLAVFGAEHDWIG